MKAILIDGPVAGQEVIITGYQEYVVEVLSQMPTPGTTEFFDIQKHIRRHWYRPIIVDSKRDIGIMSSTGMTRTQLIDTIEDLLQEAGISNRATAGMMASLQADNIVPETVMLIRQMAMINKRINDLILES